MSGEEKNADSPAEADRNDVSDGGPFGERDLEALRATQSEVRAVLDHQIATFDDVDTKATRTFRLNAVLLGLLVTAASFVAKAEVVDVGPFVNGFTVGGIVLLTASFVAAVITYTRSNVETGVGPNDVDRLIEERYSETEWLLLLLRSEAAWMRKNDRRQSINGLLLSVSLGALVLGVVALFAGIAVLNWPIS